MVEEYLKEKIDIKLQEGIIEKELLEIKTTENLFNEIKNNLINNEIINLEIIGQKFNLKNNYIIPFFLVCETKINDSKKFNSLSLSEEDTNILKNYLIKSNYSSNTITNLLKDTFPNKTNSKYKYIWYKSFNLDYLKLLCKEENIEVKFEEENSKQQCIFINKNTKTKKLIVKD